MGDKARMGAWRYAEATFPSTGRNSPWRVDVRHIGVDLSSKTFTACFLEADDTYHLATFPLTTAGLASFREELTADDRLAVEAGGNSYFFHDQVHDAVAEV